MNQDETSEIISALDDFFSHISSEAPAAREINLDTNPRVVIVTDKSGNNGENASSPRAIPFVQDADSLIDAMAAVGISADVVDHPSMSFDIDWDETRHTSRGPLAHCGDGRLVVMLADERAAARMVQFIAVSYHNHDGEIDVFPNDPDDIDVSTAPLLHTASMFSSAAGSTGSQISADAESVIGFCLLTGMDHIFKVSLERPETAMPKLEQTLDKIAARDKSLKSRLHRLFSRK